MLRKQGKRELARGQMPGQLPSAGCLDRAAGGPHLLAGCSRGGRRFFGGTERQAAQLQPLGTIRLVACTRSVMTVPRKLRERFWASGSHFCLEPENVLAKKADLHEHFKLRCAERGWVSATTSPPAGRPAARCGSRNRTRRAGLRTVRRPVSLPHLSPKAVSSANLVSTRQQCQPVELSRGGRRRRQPAVVSASRHAAAPPVAARHAAASCGTSATAQLYPHRSSRPAGRPRPRVRGAHGFLVRGAAPGCLDR